YITLVIMSDRFYQCCVDSAQFKYMRRFMTGSSCEVEQTMGTMIEFNIDQEDCDVDYMYYPINRYAFNKSQSIPDWYTKGEWVYRINSQYTHKGYVILTDDVTNQVIKHVKYELDEYHIKH